MLPPSFLTDFVCGRGAAVVLPEEGVDEAQLGEAILAEAERKEARRRFNERSTKVAKKLAQRAQLGRFQRLSFICPWQLNERMRLKK